MNEQQLRDEGARRDALDAKIDEVLGPPNPFEEACRAAGITDPEQIPKLVELAEDMKESDHILSIKAKYVLASLEGDE